MEANARTVPTHVGWREAILEVLEAHLEAVGVERCGHGPDPYDAHPRSHAMAYALYASGLAHRAAITGDPAHVADCDRVLEVLEELRVGGLPAWGLGFAAGGLAADEPYAVTTALCVRALLARHALDGERDALAAARRAARWLAFALPWRTSAAGHELPAYGTATGGLAHNVASLVGGAVYAAGAAAGDLRLRDRGAQALEGVVATQRETGWWPYAEAGDWEDKDAEVATDRVIDHVHMAYTVDGAALALGAGGDAHARLRSLREAVALGARFHLKQFWSDPDGVREKLVIAERGDRVTAPMLTRMPATYAGGGRSLVAYPQPARLWGVGATVGMLARAAAAGLDVTIGLDRVLRRVFSEHLRDPAGRFPYGPGDPRAFPRHEAHLFEGLAAAALGTAGTR